MACDMVTSEGHDLLALLGRLAWREPELDFAQSILVSERRRASADTALICIVDRKAPSQIRKEDD